MVRSVLLAVALASAPLAQGLELNEVRVGPAPGTSVVELINTGPAPIDTANVQLVIGTSFQGLGSTPLLPGGLVRLHVGAPGVDTPTDLYLPALTDPSAVAGSVALFKASAGPPPPGFFSLAGNLVDFVQWGAPFQLYSDVAAAALRWFFASTFVPAPLAGDSLAWDGSGSQAGNWFRDASPTLGAPNIQPSANRSVVGFQCSPAAFGPMLAAGVPALGNRDFAVSLQAQSIGQPGLMAFGSSLGSTPILGGACTYFVANELLRVPFVLPAAGVFALPLPLPHDPALIGQRVVVQAGIVNGFGLPQSVDTSGALVIDL